MRNPFRLRSAQKIANDEQFVRLFGAGVLDLIDDIENPFGGLVVLRSAPGGGKTSFLRLMTPRSLHLASTTLQNDRYSRPTYDALCGKGAISDDGPSVLGVMTTFTYEYRDLESIDRGFSMFHALLNAQIVIATIRAVLERNNLTYPDDLETIKTQWDPDANAIIPAQATGKDLYDWANNIEQKFYDRFDDLGSGEISGEHTRLDALKWFSTAKIKDAHGEIRVKRLLMLDDLQFLSDGQRGSLMNFLTTARADCGIWVAERMEALNYQEVLSKGALQNRDYEGVIKLENQWANRRQRTYLKFVSQVANLRARRADAFEDHEFRFFDLLEESDANYLTATWVNACKVIKARLEELTRKKPQYQSWINEAASLRGGEYDKAVHWRATEILIERDLARNQLSLGLAYSSDEDFTLKYDSDVRNAAEHFLRKEFKAPIYFGRSTLAMVSSWNVDQYIEVAGDIFEEMVAKVTGPRAKPASLMTNRQHAIIKNVAKKRWQKMPQQLPMGYDARRLLDAVGHFCQNQTFRATAPYAPGVTGFAITMEDRARLIDGTDNESIYYRKLREVLASLVAYNAVTPRLEHRNKGREYAVFYLNRLICVHFDLPVGYGGWRAKSLKELLQWLEKGAAAVKVRESLFVE